MAHCGTLRCRHSALTMVLDETESGRALGLSSSPRVTNGLGAFVAALGIYRPLQRQCPHLDTTERYTIRRSPYTSYSGSMTVPKLFSPIQVGNVSLAHRVVLAPLTRRRANREHVPSTFAIKYYAQRASMPGSLLISEGTFIAPRAGGLANVPGIWTDAQVAAWKPVRSSYCTRGQC